MARIFVSLQYLVPQHALTRLVGRLADVRITWIKNLLIRLFIRRYQVNMAEALHSDINSYQSFNDFFTRPLKPEARSITAGPGAIVCPVDGSLSCFGEISRDRLLQAKGRDYSLVDLLGGNGRLAEPFRDGYFATIYLAPKDYHRVHMPLTGRLIQSIYVPGRLFSVNQVTAEGVPNLFAVNERLVCYFDTEAGPMALILVGAMIVGGIETVWSGEEGSKKSRESLLEKQYDGQSPPVQIARGEEMGRFKMGSTVIVLFGPGSIHFTQELKQTMSVRLGELLARCRDQ